MTIGTLAALRRYPVKSLRGDVLDEIDVGADGIAGDRARALFARSGARAGKPYRGKEDDRLHLFDEAGAAAAAASERGTAVEVRAGAHFFDAAPISLIVDRWLDDLSAHLGYEVEWERFRPNFFVRASDGFALPEAALDGAELALGSVRFRVRCPIPRCVAVNRNPAQAASDDRILRYLAQHREAMMGIYCDVRTPGTARLGDALIFPGAAGQ